MFFYLAVSEKLSRAGLKNITCIDYSDVVINQRREAAKDNYPNINCLIFFIVLFYFLIILETLICHIFFILNRAGNGLSRYEF